MSDIFELEPQTDIDRRNSYINSYPHIASYFSSLHEITPQDVVRDAHMVYGWMPTVLDLYVGDDACDLAQATALLNCAKGHGEISEGDISVLAGLINNSLVGASKLLHFVAPERFAIWDSKIYAFIHRERPHNYQVNKVERYLGYLESIERYRGSREFEKFHLSVNQKMGYAVTPMRAVEIIMFLNSPKVFD